MLGSSAHTDTFARDKLPPPDQWPEFRLDGLARETQELRWAPYRKVHE